MRAVEKAQAVADSIDDVGIQLLSTRDEIRAMIDANDQRKNKGKGKCVY